MLRRHLGKHRQRQQDRKDALPRLLDMIDEPTEAASLHDSNPTRAEIRVPFTINGINYANVPPIPHQRRPPDDISFWRPGDQYVQD